MVEEQPPPDVEHNIFASHAERLAAQVRQLFRAREARDAKAMEVALRRFSAHARQEEGLRYSRRSGGRIGLRVRILGVTGRRRDGKVVIVPPEEIEVDVIHQAPNLQM